VVKRGTDSETISGRMSGKASLPHKEGSRRVAAEKETRRVDEREKKAE